MGRRFIFALGLIPALLLLPPGSQQVEPTQAERVLRLNTLGVALMEQLNFREAAARFAAILELDEDFVPAHVNLGIARFNLQEYAQAIASLSRAIELEPRQPNAHYVLGLIYRNQDRIQEAVAAFGTVAALDPNDASSNYFLGLLFSRQREYGRAIEHLRRVTAAEPYNASAHYNLAIALLRRGDREAGTAEMNEFRRLQGLFGSTTIGLQYLEQGKYSIAIDNIPDRYLPQTESSQTPARVRFSDVAAESGLAFRHAGPASAALEYESRRDLELRIVPLVGSGLSFADFNRDGWVDLFAANTGAAGELFQNRGDGTFRSVADRSGISYSGHAMAALWGDYDNDEYPDLYLVNYGANVLYHNNGDGTFTDVTAQAGTSDDAWGVAGAWVDHDHDGDLDLAIANFSDSSSATAGTFPDALPGATNVLYRNNGDGTFTDVSLESGLGGRAAKSLALAVTDYDNSRDIDVLVANFDAPNRLFSNLRDGTFRDLAAQAGIQDRPATLGVTAADLDGDGRTDILEAGAAETRLFMSRGGNAFVLQTLSGSSAAIGALAFDVDNDRDQDILLVSSALLNAPARAFTLLENRGGRFVDATERSGLSSFQSLPVRGISLADFDNDGDLDIAASVNGGAPLLLRNEGGNRNNWIQVGLRSTSSNRPGIGSKVELRTGRFYQKQEVYGGGGFLSQSPPLVHFGLGTRRQVDMLRLVWPGGILQSEIDVPINQRTEIVELDRKGTSCPLLYVWDGEGYRFQTDFLGGSAYGYLQAPGLYNHPDTDEYIKLKREDVAARDGRLAVALNNQLEEVILFDQLELVAVDHPADYDVFPDEKLMPGPPYLDFRILTASSPRPPRAAHNGRGEDVLEEIAEKDRVYPPLFSPLPFKGYADLHELVLDLGPAVTDNAVLLMQAWIDYADSTSNLAAAQAGYQLIPPFLQVQDEGGAWVTVMERMGFPAGLPKTMTVDLSGKFLSGSRRVRILTSMRIHWDQILVESEPQRADYRLRRLAPASAQLGFHGFPEFSSPDGKEPRIYEHSKSTPHAQWKVHVGGYTRFGDVLPLLQSRDDMFVITRSGDQIEASFELASLPRIPSGWVRDWLVYVDGFGKDMDVNSARPDTIGPLPFHGMSAYPYPSTEHYPHSDRHRNYLLHWNTRIEEHWMPRLDGRRAGTAGVPARR